MPEPDNQDQDEPYDMVLLDKTSKESHRLASGIYLLTFLLGSFALNNLYLRLVADYLTSVFRISFFYMGILSLPFLGALHGFYVYVYLAKDPAWEKYKITNVPWPWVLDPAAWKRRLPNLVFTYLFNYFVLGPIIVQISIYLNSPRVDVETSPGLFEYAWQILFGVFAEDFFFYWGHRFLHLPWFYKNVHKKHHEHFNTITVSAIYAHPLEFIIGNSLPVFAVLYILKSRMHVVTLSTWLNLRLLSTHAGHSGYEMPLSLYKVLPSTTTGIYHCYHHIKNAGNYGSTFAFWDTFFGTSAPYDKEQRLREELLSRKVKID